MRNYYFLCITILISQVSYATIWRVNNASNSTPDFTTVQSGIDSDLVVNGDTLMVEGSASEYSGFTVDKRLVIIGEGYFLSENQNVSFGGVGTIVEGDASFVEGSQGSVIEGIIFGNNSTGYGPNIRVDEIVVRKCYLQNGIDISSNVKGLIIIQNYFNGDFDFASTGYSLQGVIFRNNIVNTDFSFTTSVQTPRTFASVANNLFLGDVSVSTSAYRSNIWLPQTSSTISVTAGIKEYNVNLNVDMGAENNNSIITAGTELYTGTGSTDSKWQLKEDSSYKGQGKGGTDPGPFGGANPYVLSGLSAIPVIYEISTTGFGSTQEGLPVTIKVRTSN